MIPPDACKEVARHPVHCEAGLKMHVHGDRLTSGLACLKP